MDEKYEEKYEAEVKEHAHDHVPIIKNSKIAFWEKSRPLWVQMIQIFASLLQKRLCTETVSDCVTVTPVIHL